MKRRNLLKAALVLPAALSAPGRLMAGNVAVNEAKAAKPPWRHATAAFGEMKYASDFKRFDYVNAAAPKGGSARQIGLGTFDSFNLVIAGIKGAPAAGLDMLYDTLLAQSLDEVASAYGLIAEAISFPADMSWVAFRLRADAKWHDGTPITVEDVVFSFTAFKKHNPQAGANYHHVAKAEKTGDHEVTFRLDPGAGRDLPQLLGQLTILPKHWWEGTTKDGKKRDIGNTTLEPPLGSGPYRIKKFSPGRSIDYERVQDYWARDLNVNVGKNNLDELSFDYFFDASVAVQAFKANTIDWRVENSAKNWATEYNFPAVQDKRVILEEFPINNVGIMQAFAFNIRREKFKNLQVRLAFNYAFDFEEMNRQIFFGQYKRIASYFQGTDLAASGLPGKRELALLEPLRDRVPAELFRTAYSNPVSANEAQARDNMRQALVLFKKAGYVVRNQQLVNAASGEPFSVEFITDNRLFERVFLFYKPWLERLGIAVTIRTMDEPQYENRLRDWDFDIVTYGWGETLLPGNELHAYFGSAAADEHGSENVIGIKNSAVDTLIDKVVAANTRADLIAAARALDRVLLWNYYVVPQWSYNKLRTARWDRFSRPSQLPKYGMSAFPGLWWWDAGKAAKTGPRA